MFSRWDRAAWTSARGASRTSCRACPGAHRPRGGRTGDPRVQTVQGLSSRRARPAGWCWPLRPWAPSAGDRATCEACFRQIPFPDHARDGRAVGPKPKIPLGFTPRWDFVHLGGASWHLHVAVSSVTPSRRQPGGSAGSCPAPRRGEPERGGDHHHDVDDLACVDHHHDDRAADPLRDGSGTVAARRVPPHCHDARPARDDLPRRQGKGGGGQVEPQHRRRPAGGNDCDLRATSGQSCGAGGPPLRDELCCRRRWPVPVLESGCRWPGPERRGLRRSRGDQARPWPRWLRTICTKQRPLGRRHALRCVRLVGRTLISSRSWPPSIPARGVRS